MPFAKFATFAPENTGRIGSVPKNPSGKLLKRELRQRYPPA